MKQLKYYLLTALIGILLGIGGCLLYQKRHAKPPVEPTAQLDSLNHKVDSLQLEIDKLKDHADTVYITKWKTKKEYDEKANDIIDQSADADWQYYTNFLRARFPGDSLTIKANEPTVQ